MFKVILFSLFFSCSLMTNEKSTTSWESWKENFINDIEKKGKYKKKTIGHLYNISFNPRVVELDRNQPEFTLSFEEYYNKVVTDTVVKKGKIKKKINREILNKISNNYKVDKDIITALWGIETYYGTYLGKFDILNSLASLIYDGRRKKFFQKQFECALDILEEEHIPRSQFVGSWAGAFGHTQFMPTTFMNYSVDFNNDGKKNLISDNHDALASGANYLSRLGWNIKNPWGEEFLTEDTEIIKKSDNNKDFKSLSFWKSNGFKPKKLYTNEVKLRLITVGKELEKKKNYLVTQNFDILLNWNKSNFFALAVGMLSDKIKNHE